MPLRSAPGPPRPEQNYPSRTTRAELHSLPVGFRCSVMQWCILKKLDDEIDIANFEAENEAWNFMNEYTRPKTPESPPHAAPPSSTPTPDIPAVSVEAPAPTTSPRKGRKRRQSKDQQPT